MNKRQVLGLPVTPTLKDAKIEIRKKKGNKVNEINIPQVTMQKIYYCTIYCLNIARHYIYICKQRDTRPNVQMYIQIAERTVEIERQIAKDYNSLDTLKRNGLD